MTRKTKILSVSLPPTLTKAVDELSKQTDQTRSELMRNALREYLLDVKEDRQRFIEAYKLTRDEKTYNMDELRASCDL